MIHRRTLAAFLLLPWSAATASAQAAVLDEGTFNVFLQGREVGTETFRIQRSGMGDDARIVAVGNVALETPSGRLTMAPNIRASTDLAPQAYTNEIAGAREARVSGVVEGGRFTTRVTSPAGESQREFRVGSGTVLLEQDVAYLYYFLSRQVEEGGTLAVIVPSTGEQVRFQVVSSRVEPFRLGREQLDVRHVRLEGGERIHEVWLDDQGRVLRVEIPSRAYRAERVGS